MSQEIVQILKEKPSAKNVQVWSQKFSSAMALVKVRTLDDIVALSTQRKYSTALGFIAREGGEQVIQDFLSLCIVDYLEYLTLGDNNTMGANQIRQTVELILEEPDFRSMMIEDYKLFFNQAKKGMFGQIYGRVDGQTIITWLRQYLEDRCIFFAMRSEAEANVARSGYSEKLGDKYLKKIAEELIEKNKEKQNAK